MVENLQQSEQLEGEVLIAGESIGRFRYDFSYNTYETNSMQIKLFDLPRLILGGAKAQKVEVITQFSWGVYKLQLNSELTGFKSNGRSSQHTMPVSTFEVENYYSKDKMPAKLSVGYLFPITSITDCSRNTLHQLTYEYFKGSFDEKLRDVIHRIDPLIIGSSIGEIKLEDEFDFHELGNNKYPQLHVLRRSCAGLETAVQEEDRVPKMLEEIDIAVERLFRIISLVERNRISWHARRYFVTSADGDPVSGAKTYRWVSPMSSRYQSNLNEYKARRNTVSMFYSAYDKLADDNRSDLDRSIENFKIANCAPTLEAQLIHWYSCLDFFRHHYFRRNKQKSFSKDLVRMFDRKNLPIDDLLPLSLINDIRRASSKAPKFDFTELRDRYIHEGFDAFEGKGYNAIQMIMDMRALAERLLADYIGLDYSNTSLGKRSLY